MNSAHQLAIASEAREIDESTARAQAAVKPRNALEAMAAKLSISPPALKSTLMKTAFSACKTDEEFMALVVVANEYGLNPMLKEMYAFPAKGGGIVPMVSIDGWIRIMNEHPAFDGIEFDYHDKDGKTDAIEAVIFRKDRAHPVKVIEYMTECVRGTDPWKQAPRRMLRHRALMQCARVAFGFSGIYSEGDEIEAGDVVEITPTVLPSKQTIAEELGDEIPDFDQQTGEVREEPAGLTEIDEDAARALDAGEHLEGRDEADMGEAHAEEEESPTVAKLKQIRATIASATNTKTLDHVDREWVNARGAYDDDTAAEIDGLIAAKKRELSA